MNLLKFRQISWATQWLVPIPDYNLSNLNCVLLLLQRERRKHHNEQWALNISISLDLISNIKLLSAVIKMTLPRTRFIVLSSVDPVASPCIISRILALSRDPTQYRFVSSTWNDTGMVSIVIALATKSQPFKFKRGYFCCYKYSTCILVTQKSSTGGLYTATQGSLGSVVNGNRFCSASLQSYDSISHNTGTSMNLGVSPALTTLSEHAIHSMQSTKYESIWQIVISCVKNAPFQILLIHIPIKRNETNIDIQFVMTLHYQKTRDLIKRASFYKSWNDFDTGPHFRLPPER